MHHYRTDSMLALACGIFAPSAAFAQAIDIDDPIQPAEAIIVTGSRGLERTVADSPVPVDVFSEEAINSVSFTDTNDVLKTLVPSYTVSRQPISDGSSFIRPASMRGLPTDKTLVLVNSKRRHRAALVTIGGSGTQGPDIATIPTISLASVEVLRDGAAAQYGSDAIAGVINFLLKDDPHGVDLEAEIGEFYEGDGFEYKFAGNIGLPLGDMGFINLSAEYSNADSTNRAQQYCESFFCVTEYAALPGNEDYAAAVEGIDTIQPWGRPSGEAVRTFVNAGYELSAAAEVYAFGNYSWSTSTSNFFYRYPANGTIEDLRLEDGSIYNPTERFPGGFTPLFSGDVEDYSALGGIRGDISSAFSYDFSLRYGRSEISYLLENTINPSLGPESPTSFKPGDLINDELQFQADFMLTHDVGLASEIALAFGGTYFEEGYETVEGELASYHAGPFGSPDPFDFCNTDGTPTLAGSSLSFSAGLNCADPADPVYQVVGVGSNGFPGYSPEFSGSYDRDSYSFYGNIGADVTDRLFLEGALRFENYSDFDSQLIYKVAGRFEILDGLGIRASHGTGFRAPTPGQQGTTNVSTRIPNGFPVATGLFPASSAIAAALGAVPLEPETSTNWTAGISGAFGGLTYSIDYYRIELEDRLQARSTITVVDDCIPSTPEIDSECIGFRGRMIDAGVAGAQSIGGVFYFQNLFDTVTQGVDIVLSYSQSWSGGTSGLVAAINYNETEFDGDVPAQFNAEDQYDFLNAEPNWRAVFTATHETGPFNFLARANYYGPYSNSDGAGGPLISQDFDSELLIDVEASYTWRDMLTLSIGARNVFDNYPEPGEFEVCCGRIYRSDSIVDWQGGYYYARLRASF